MIRYYSDLSKALVEDLQENPVYGWRLIEIAEDQGECDYDLTRWLVEDDYIVAPSPMEMKVVNPVFKKYDDGALRIENRAQCWT